MVNLHVINVRELVCRFKRSNRWGGARVKLIALFTSRVLGLVFCDIFIMAAVTLSRSPVVSYTLGAAVSSVIASIPWKRVLDVAWSVYFRYTNYDGLICIAMICSTDAFCYRYWCVCSNSHLALGEVISWALCVALNICRIVDCS
jgi:hypothetical protein